jgi:hypothetical protein
MSYSGVTGFLRQGLVGLSFFVVEHQPSLSGILLGFLTYKPQLGGAFPARAAGLTQLGYGDKPGACRRSGSCLWVSGVAVFDLLSV